MIGKTKAVKRTKKTTTKTAARSVAPKAVNSAALAVTAPAAPAIVPPVVPAAPVRSAIPAPARASESPAPTTIEAKIDVGFGNRLFVRGEGPGLNWDHGVPLVCVDAQTWRWSGNVTAPLTFKLLLNDSVWSRGEDLRAKPGQKVEVHPSF